MSAINLVIHVRLTNYHNITTPQQNQRPTLDRHQMFVNFTLHSLTTCKYLSTRVVPGQKFDPMNRPTRYVTGDCGDVFPGTLTEYQTQNNEEKTHKKLTIKPLCKMHKNSRLNLNHQAAVQLLVCTYDCIQPVLKVKVQERSKLVSPTIPRGKVSRGKCRRVGVWKLFF